MKRTNCIFIVCLINICLFISCDKQNDLVDEQNSTNEERIKEYSSNNFTFIYKETAYSSEYIRKDSSLLFIDKSVNDLYNNIKMNPNSEAVIYPNGDVEYFDDSIDIDSLMKKRNNLTRGPAVGKALEATLTIYEDTKYNGRKTTFVVGGIYNGIRFNDLGVINFDRTISSLRMNTKYYRYSLDGYLGSKVVLHSELNCEGWSKTWATPHDGEDLHYVHNMPGQPMGSPPYQTDNWNDKARSLNFFLY